MIKLFGADSNMPSNTVLTNGYKLYDWVMRKNSFPAFWGRGFMGAGAVAAEKIEFLHKKRCGIMLMVNNLKELWAGEDGSEAVEESLREQKR